MASISLKGFQNIQKFLKRVQLTGEEVIEWIEIHNFAEGAIQELKQHEVQQQLRAAATAKQPAQPNPEVAAAVKEAIAAQPEPAIQPVTEDQA